MSSTYAAKPRTVYFLRPVGERGPIKVGCSLQPEKRRQSLAAQIGRPLEIVTTIPGRMLDEMRIHSAFWSDHRGGEWFNWSHGLQSLVEAAKYGGLDYDTLPPAMVRPMPGKRRPWTDEQKAKARHSRNSAKRAA